MTGPTQTRHMPRVAAEPFMRVVGEMLDLEEQAAEDDRSFTDAIVVDHPPPRTRTKRSRPRNRQKSRYRTELQKPFRSPIAPSMAAKPNTATASGKSRPYWPGWWDNRLAR